MKLCCSAEDHSAPSLLSCPKALLAASLPQGILSTPHTAPEPQGGLEQSCQTAPLTPSLRLPEPAQLTLSSHSPAALSPREERLRSQLQTLKAIHHHPPQCPEHARKRQIPPWPGETFLSLSCQPCEAEGREGSSCGGSFLTALQLLEKFCEPEELQS